MQIELKLYASLGQYLPETAVHNVALIDVADGVNPEKVLSDRGVPLDQCHLVLVNGIYLAPSERGGHVLEDGDALAVWPPVAGG